MASIFKQRMLAGATAFTIAQGWSGSALAQISPPAPASPASDMTAPGSPALSEAGLEEIVVTAQRRSENLQRAAISITSVGADQLARRSITTAADLTVAVPALQASNQAGFTAFFIRGIGSFAFNAYAEPAIAFNMNGVYISRPNAVNGQFFDVERVEVLKGPQGTLYGRNATGGAINLIAHKPDLGRFGGFASFQYGNYNEVLATGAVNVPMGENGALRVAFQSEDHDGYFRDGTDDADSKSLRISMRSQLTPDLEINMIGDYVKLGGKGGGAALLPLGTTPARGGLGDPAAVAYYNNAAANLFVFPGAIVPVPQYLARLDVETGGFLAEVTANTSIGTLTLLPAYREVHTDNFSTTPGFFLTDRTDQEQTSFEARLASDDDRPLRYLFGGYFFKERADFDINADVQFVGVSHVSGNLTTKTAAAFSQLTYAFTPSFRVTGGIRYSWERKTFDAANNTAPPVFFTSGPGLNPFVIAPTPPNIVTNTSRKFKSTTWKAGVEWDAGPSSLMYANVSTGYKAGGFFMSAANNSFDPEKVTAYVIGSKNRFFSNSLQLNAELFLLKYRDQQLSHLGLVQTTNGLPTAGFPTENVGRSTIYGLELEAQYLITQTTKLSLVGNYVHAKYDEFIYTTPDTSPLSGLPAGTIPATTGCSSTLASPVWVVDCSGRAAYQVPKLTLTGGIQQTFNLANGGSFAAEIRSRYESGKWLSETFYPGTRSGSNTLTDASLTYNSPNDSWSLTGYVNNIENDDVVAIAQPVGTFPTFPAILGTLRPPRTYGVRAQVNF